MPKTEDGIILNWIKQKQMLYREFSLHLISEVDYLKKADELDNMIKSRTTEIITKMNLENKKKEEEIHLRRMEKMSEVAKVAKVEKPVVVAKPAKVEKPAKAEKVVKPKVETRASVILEVLALKSIKNLEAATDKVFEKRPTDAKNKIRSQIAVMIKEIKAGKKPAYTFDDANFQLNVKQ